MYLLCLWRTIAMCVNVCLLCDLSIGAMVGMGW